MAGVVGPLETVHAHATPGPLHARPALDHEALSGMPAASLVGFRLCLSRQLLKTSSSSKLRFGEVEALAPVFLQRALSLWI